MNQLTIKSFICTFLSRAEKGVKVKFPGLITIFQSLDICWTFLPGQALCGPCRDETHKAKMFSQHDVIHMSKKTKELKKKVLKNIFCNCQQLCNSNKVWNWFIYSLSAMQCQWFIIHVSYSIEAGSIHHNHWVRKWSDHM